MKVVGRKAGKNSYQMKAPEDMAPQLISRASEHITDVDSLGLLTFDIRIAETTFRIHVSSQELWGILYPALSWQAIELSSSPDVEIYAVDGLNLVQSPWGLENFLEGNRIQGLDSGGVLGTFDIENGVLNLFDRRSSSGLFWVGSVSDIPEWEFGAPLRRLIEWALLDRGLYVVHSAAVGIGERGVLICGSGGSGKSTTTALCIGDDFCTTGDDYCAISIDKPHKVFGIFGLLKLIPNSVGTDRFFDSPQLRQRSDGKVHYSIKGKMAQSLTISAIVFPKVGSYSKATIPIAPKQAFLRLLSSTLNQASLPQPQIMTALGSLSRSVDAFEFGVGSDFDLVRSVIRGLCKK